MHVAGTYYSRFRMKAKPGGRPLQFFLKPVAQVRSSRRDGIEAPIASLLQPKATTYIAIHIPLWLDRKTECDVTRIGHIIRV